MCLLLFLVNNFYFWLLINYSPLRPNTTRDFRLKWTGHVKVTSNDVSMQIKFLCFHDIFAKHLIINVSEKKFMRM